MISRISFIFSFFWAHEVPILPLTLFFENRLDWIESLWLLSLPCSALSRHLPCRPPPHPTAQSAAASIPKSLPGAPASVERGLLQRVCSGRAAACSLPAGGGAELPVGEHGVTTPRPPAVRKITGSHRINSHVAAGEIAVT